MTTLAELVAIADCEELEAAWFRGQAEWREPLPSLLRVENSPVDPSEDLATCETRLMAEFDRRAPLRLGRRPHDWVETMTLLQHSGCPTRLLDWTGSPLAALFFAVTEGEAIDGVVWCLDLAELSGCLDHDRVLAETGMSRFDGHRLDRWLAGKPHHAVPIVPRHVADRLAWQHGYFTMHALTGAGDTRTIPVLAGEIRVPAAAKPRLFVELTRVGISQATLFPDIGGLATQIGWERTGWRKRLPPEQRGRITSARRRSHRPR